MTSRARQYGPPPTARSRGALHGQPDHSVVVAATPVDDARLLGAPVDEQEEVVADELHLVQRLVERHGRGPVGLLAYDGRTVTDHLQRTDVVNSGRVGPVL